MLAMILALLILVGCTSLESRSSAPSDAVPTQSITAVPSQTSAQPASPVITTRADIDPAPAVTPSLPPDKTPEPTSTPTPRDGRTEIAEGFYYIKLTDALKERITGLSYPEDDDDIAISYSDLRYVAIQYVDFEGKQQDGELIVNKKLAGEVLEIFYELYKEKYPLASVRLVDDYGQPGDDTLSMEDNNTSAFCYRRVTGSKTLSRHSLGAAIDINPLLNPYIDGDRVAPENGAKYVDRTLGLPGMIDHKDLCYKLFKKHGWSWGGDWTGDKDYQHFSKKIE